MIRLRDVSLLAASVFIGCSPVVDPSNSPDAQIDAPDTTAPGIASANVTDMGTKFSVIDPVVITFDEDMDPATVTATSVTLIYETQAGYSYYVEQSTFTPTNGAVADPVAPVRGTVAYDAASRKLTFTPEQPLPYGARLVLQLTDLKDTNGNAFSSTLRFRTFANTAVRQVQFTGAGNTQTYTRFGADANGWRDRSARYFSTGGDGMWFTGDDPAGENIDFTYSPDGRLLRENYMDPGTDGLYNTADDVPANRFEWTWDAQGRITERTFYNTPGTDGVWNNADDNMIYVAPYIYMNDRLVGVTFFQNAGTDGVFRTLDDRCQNYVDHEYNTRGFKTRDILKTCGSDQLPRTADDQFQRVTDYTYDAQDRLVLTAPRSNPGTDGMWLTADDLYSGVTRLERDSAGLVTSTIGYGGAGTDGMWLTADDAISVITKMTYTAQKLVLESSQYTAPGVDTVWNTPDDVLNTYTLFTYDALGNRTDSKSYIAGTDGMFRTPDDRVTIDVDYDTSL